MADYNIPFDIQEEVMKRLPIKSLIRFRSVSRPWKSFIHSSKFIAGYQQAQCLLVSYFNDAHDHIKYVSVVDDDTYPERELSLVAPVSVKYIRLEGSSQGLFCFLNYYYSNNSGRNTAVIWNPTIRKSVDIVVPNVRNVWPYKTIVGFGVCPLTCDPKLVKIIYVESYHEPQSRSTTQLQVEVFTLSSGVWTSLSINLPHKLIWFTTDHVDIDGFIYWSIVVDMFYLDGRLRWNNMIMSFDMTGNEFTEIYLPGNLTNYEEVGFSISKLRESLVVLEYEKRLTPEKQVYGVWMMENGNPKSFTKLYTIDLPDGLYNKQVILGFSKSGKPIIADPEAGSISVYEHNTKDINDIEIPGNPNLRFAISYTETLLLLNH